MCRIEEHNGNVEKVDYRKEIEEALSEVTEDEMQNLIKEEKGYRI